MTTTMDRIAIVGGGLASLSAAERLRELGHHGQIVMVGQEPRAPYNRTPLSKQLLTGRYRPTDLRLTTYTDPRAEWRLGVSATALDVTNRQLSLSDGTELAYDGLVIATGVTPRTLPGTPHHSPRVLTLRTLDDARAIDRLWSAQGVRRVAVVGGGFIGCELAAAARARALDVSLVDVSPTLLGHSLGHTLGGLMTDVHRRAGVDVHLGTAVRDWVEHDKGIELHLNDGEQIRADAVVVGVGATPITSWLDGSGLDTSNGVLCTATGAVVDSLEQAHPEIVAAGDVARWPNLRFDEIPRRIEHWINAVEMGRHVAHTLLHPDDAQPFTPVPRFWSEQHGTRIQAAGMIALADSMTIVEGSVRARSLVATYTRATTIVGVVTLNAPRRLQHYTRLVGGPVDAIRATPTRRRRPVLA